MTVHAYLVTSSPGDRMDLWAATAMVTNWLDCRGPDERQTWHVMVPGEHASAFLDIARTRPGVTVEAIRGAGESETYELLCGEPGTGWDPANWTPEDDPDDELEDENDPDDDNQEGGE